MTKAALFASAGSETIFDYEARDSSNRLRIVSVRSANDERSSVVEILIMSLYLDQLSLVPANQPNDVS